jgi:drug/metabolite transporter (DMT)-like permease
LIFKKPLTRRYVFALMLALSGVTIVITHRPGAGWQEAALGELVVGTYFGRWLCCTLAQ